MTGSPLGGAVAPGSGGPVSGELLGDVTGPVGDTLVTRIQQIPVDLGGEPPVGHALVTALVGEQVKIMTAPRSVDRVFWSEGTAGVQPPVYNNWAEALLAAQSLPAFAQIGILDGASPPTIPAGTHALEQRIEVVGLCSSTERITLSIADGAVLQDLPRMANVAMTPVVSTPIFTSTRDGLDLELDNVFLLASETPGSSPPFQLNYTSSRILLRGGTWIQGGSTGIGTLPATKSLNLTVERALVDANLLQGGAGDLYATFYPGSIVPDLAAFTGSISGSDKLRDQLADTNGSHFDFGAHRLENVATPTANDHAATKGYVDGAIGGPYVPTSRTVNTGDGISGGGPLNGDLSLSLDYFEGTPSAPSVSGGGGATAQPSHGDHSHPIEDVATRAAASALAGTEVVAVDQSGPKKISVASIAAFQAAGSKSIAGSGALSLTSDEVAVEHLELTGALTGNRTLTMPSGVRALWITRSTTSTGLVRLNGASSGFIHFAPGQTRRIIQDGGGVLRCEAPRVLALDLLVTLTGDVVGDNDHTLLMLPGPVFVDRCEVVCEEAVTGGTVQTSVGDSGSYAQLLTLGAIASVGDTRGDVASHAGSAFTNNQAAKYPSSTTLKLRATVAGATLTAGKVRVLLVARYVGT